MQEALEGAFFGSQAVDGPAAEKAGVVGGDVLLRGVSISSLNLLIRLDGHLLLETCWRKVSIEIWSMLREKVIGKRY